MTTGAHVGSGRPLVLSFPTHLDQWTVRGVQHSGRVGRGLCGFDELLGAMRTFWPNPRVSRCSQERRSGWRWGDECHTELH